MILDIIVKFKPLVVSSYINHSICDTTATVSDSSRSKCNGTNPD